HVVFDHRYVPMTRPAADRHLGRDEYALAESDPLVEHDAHPPVTKPSACAQIRLWRNHAVEQQEDQTVDDPWEDRHTSVHEPPLHAVEMDRVQLADGRLKTNSLLPVA